MKFYYKTTASGTPTIATSVAGVQGSGNEKNFFVEGSTTADTYKLYFGANLEYQLVGATAGKPNAWSDAKTGSHDYKEVTGNMCQNARGVADTAPCTTIKFRVKANPATNTKASGVVTSLASDIPSAGDGTSATYLLTATANSAIDITATNSYKYQFATLNADGEVTALGTAWIAGTNGKATKTLATTSDTNLASGSATHIRFRKATTGITTPWINVVAPAAPTAGAGTGTTYSLTATANTAVTVKVADEYEFKFKDDSGSHEGTWKDTDVSAGVAITLAGEGNTAKKTALGFTANGKTASHIKFRKKATATSVHGVDTGWIAVTAANAPAKANAKNALSTNKYFVAEHTTPGAFRLYFGNTLEYSLGDGTNWNAWSTATGSGTSNTEYKLVTGNLCNSGANPCTQVKFRIKAVIDPASASKAIHSLPTAAIDGIIDPVLKAVALTKKVGGTTKQMEAGDVIKLTFSETMTKAGATEQFTVIGSKGATSNAGTVKIYKGDGTTTDATTLVAQFATVNHPGTAAAVMKFTSAGNGSWTQTTVADDTLTITLATKVSGTAQDTGNLSAASIWCCCD